MKVELGDDATYRITRMGFVSFCMALGEVLEFDNVLYLLGLTMNLLLVSTMVDLRFAFEFDDNQIIFRGRN